MVGDTPGAQIESRVHDLLAEIKTSVKRLLVAERIHYNVEGEVYTKFRDFDSDTSSLRVQEMSSDSNMKDPEFNIHLFIFDELPASSGDYTALDFNLSSSRSVTEISGVKDGRHYQYPGRVSDASDLSELADLLKDAPARQTTADV